MAMARLFLSLLLLLTAHDGAQAAFAPPAAFAPTALRKEGSVRQLPSSAALRVEKSPSDEKSNVAAAADTGKFLIPTIALVSISLTTLAAFTQHLPGPPIDATAPPPFFATIPFGVFFSGSCDPYSPSLIYRDIASTIISLVGAAIYVKAITHSNKIGKIESRDSRKLIHTFSAPIFILLWPMFSNAYGARVFASIIPLLNVLRLFLAGTSGSKQWMRSESELAGAISRSGDAKEALGGPFIYVLILLFSTLFFWTDSYIGVVSLCNMALGDGLADLVGRRFGSSNKWFFNKSKSMAGSAAFVAGSFVGSYGLISWLTSMGAMEALDLSPMGLAGRLLAIAVVCAGVELIPVGDDNWSVPLSAALMTAFFLN